MAGYNDTRNLIIEALMGRQAGTEIQPEKHQAYALNMLDYVRSVELVSSSTLVGLAEESTVPVQPDQGKVCYIAGVGQDRTVTFSNFIDDEGNPISITTGEMEGVFVILLWNMEHWVAHTFNTNIISSAESANFYYGYNIRKTYTSVAAMNADSVNPIGTDGRLIKIGELVTVVNSTTPAENGYYSYEGSENGWLLQSGFSFEIVQTTGTDINKTMSQKAITDELAQLAGGSTKTLKNVEDEIVQLAGNTIKKSDGVYSDNYYINSCIKGVYVFGDTSEIEALKNDTFTFDVFRWETSPRIRIRNVAGTVMNPQVYPQTRKVSEYNITALYSFIYPSVKVYVLVDRNVIAKQSSDPNYYQTGKVNPAFWSAKDNIVKNFLNDHLYMFNNSVSTRQIELGAGVISGISVKNRVNNANYSIGGIENTTNFPYFVRINKWVDGVLEKFSTRNISDDHTKPIVIKIDDTLIEIKIDWRLYDGAWNDNSFVAVLSDDVYENNFYLTSLEFKELEVNADNAISRVDDSISNLNVVKTQVQNLGDSNTEAISQFAIILNNLQQIVESINAEEITYLYNTLIGNYQSVVNTIGDNKDEFNLELENISNNLTSSVSDLIQMIENKNTVVGEKEITILNISDSLKSYIDSAGGGTITNFPDEDTITQDGNALSVKPLNKTENRNLGIVPLKELGELSPFTIYEAKENIYSESVVSIPHGSKIIPVAGMLDATISGGERDTVHSSNIGMVQDDVSYAIHNGNIIRKVLRNKYNIILDGYYHVQFSNHVEINHDFHISGGGIKLLGNYYFIPKENSSFIANNVEFEGVARESYLINIRMIEYSLNSVIFNDCVLKRIRCYIRFADIPNLGIDNFVIKNCLSEESIEQFYIRDAKVSRIAVIENNNVIDFRGPFVSLTTSNGAEHSVDKAFNSATLICQNNHFKGIPSAVSAYHCAILAEIRRCVFRNNHIEDIINFSQSTSATAYDAYFNVCELWFVGNTIKNLMSFSTDGINKPRCEYGKSKGNLVEDAAFSLRYFADNIWYVDGDYLMSLGASESDIWADIFNTTATSVIDEFIFKNNNVQLTKGHLRGLYSTSNARIYRIEDNVFDCDYITNNLLLPDNHYINEVIIRNNIFKFRKGRSPFPLISESNFTSQDFPTELVLVENNTSLGCSLVGQITSAKKMIWRNNNGDVTNEIGNLVMPGTLIAGGMKGEIDFSVRLPKILSENPGEIILYFSSECRGKIAISTDRLPVTANFRMIYNVNDPFNINYILRYKERVWKELIFKLNYNNNQLHLTDMNGVVTELDINTFPNIVLDPNNGGGLRPLLIRKVQSDINMIIFSCFSVEDSTDIFSDITLECQVY